MPGTTSTSTVTTPPLDGDDSTCSKEQLHLDTQIQDKCKEDVETLQDHQSPSSELAQAQEQQFPEGGLRAWLTVLGGCLVTFSTFGVVQSFGVYQDYYTRISLREQTPSAISWIGSVQVFFLFALGLPSGRLFDAGYFHHCVLGGSTLYVFSAFMLSLTQPHKYYQHFLAQGVGMGTGMGIMFLPSLSVTSHYFRARRSLAMGVVIAGSSLGGCIYPILLNSLFARPNGFATGVRAQAILDLGLLIIANAVMRPRPPKRASSNGAANGGGGASGRPVRVFEILVDVPYMVFALGGFLLFWGVFVPFFYLQLYAVKHSVSPAFTKYSITVMNAASIFGRTVPNLMADSYGPMNVLIPSSLVSGALIFSMFGASSVAGVATFGVFYGFFSGGVVSLISPAVASFATRNDLSDVGIRIGLTSFMLAFALLTGNPIAGALLSPPLYRWHSPLIFAAVVIFGGVACHLVARRALVIRRGTSIT